MSRTKILERLGDERLGDGAVFVTFTANILKNKTEIAPSPKCYNKAEVKYGKDTYPIYLNVGNAKNKTGYHIYDITRKIRGTAKHNALERVNNDLRSEISPLYNTLPQTKPVVKTKSENSEKGWERLGDGAVFVTFTANILKKQNRNCPVPKVLSFGLPFFQPIKSMRCKI